MQVILHNKLAYFSGTWETKVSNKEKREQRKKDKSSSDGSASPGGGETPVNAPQEQPKAPVAPVAPAAPAPASQKKKKGFFNHVYFHLVCDFLLLRRYSFDEGKGVTCTCIHAHEAQDHLR